MGLVRHGDWFPSPRFSISLPAWDKHSAMSAKRGRSTRTSFRARNTTLQTEPRAAPTCADVEKAVPMLMHAFSTLGSHDMRASLAAGLFQHGANSEEQQDTPACEEFASAIVAAILQARMRDPFAHLPNDVVQVVLGFFDPAEIIPLRRVCKLWCGACNTAFSHMTFFDLTSGIVGICVDQHDEYTRKERVAFAVRFVATHCCSVDTLRLVVDKHEFSEEDVVMLMVANPHIKALVLGSRSSDRCEEMDMMALRGLRSCGSNLQVLVMEFPLADSDYMLIAQIAPQLAALQVRATSSQHPPLSTAGLISFIGKAPNLRLLELTGVVALMDNGEPDCSAPAANNLHHLWLRNYEVDRPSFDFVLRCIGRELRSISMREYYPVDASYVFERICTRCPRIQRVSTDTDMMTEQLARTISHMRDLRILSVPNKLSDAETTLLRSHVSAYGNSVGNDDQAAQSRSLKVCTHDDVTPELRFECVVREENIPVDLTPCVDVLYAEYY